MSASHYEEDSASPFSGATLSWKDRDTWVPLLTAWIEPHLRKTGLATLARKPRARLYRDDTGWVDRIANVALDPIELIISDLADDLLEARLVAYHATRLIDAGDVHRSGLNRNDPAVLADLARAIVAEEEELAFLRPVIEHRLTHFEDWDRDTARLYVVADDREFLESSGHYLLYGSEWMQVLLGWEAHGALLQRGAPTLFRFALPISATHSSAREHFAEMMLREWSYQRTMGDEEPRSIDFSFVLRRDIPADWILDHSHPARIRDPFYKRVRTNPFLSCAHCTASSVAQNPYLGSRHD